MDKKNTILLTVIAVATLLVAIVGATFAYFTAQMGPGTNTNITVTTSTQDTLSYGAFKALYLVANQENFAEGKGTQKASAGGTISLQANSNDPENFSAADYCYTATINIALNQFEYAPEGTEGKTDDNKAELVLALSKDGHNYSTGELESLSYVTFTDQLVCTQENNKITFTDDECDKNQTFNGFDITETGKTGATAIKIPNHEFTGQSEANAEKLKYVFHITADEAGKTVNHQWNADLYFVNHEWDQQYNTHKMFTATWNFVTVDCTSGNPVES